MPFHRTHLAAVLTRLWVIAATVWGASCREPGPLARIHSASDARSSATISNSAPKAAQPKTPSMDTIDAFLAQYAQTYRFSLGHPSGMRFLPDGSVVFQRSESRSFTRDVYLRTVDGQERVFLTAAQVLAGADDILSAEEKARRERTRQAARGITQFEVSQDGRRAVVALAGRLFAVDMQTALVRPVGDPDAGYALDPQLAPNGNLIATVRGGHVHVVDATSGKERRLTPDTFEGGSWGSAEFVAQEEMGRMRGTWWSPKSAMLLVQHSDLRRVERLAIVDPMAPEKKPATFSYPRAGTPNVVVKLALFSVKGGKPVWVTWDRDRWEYLVDVTWSTGGNGTPLLVVQDRRQKELAVLRLNVDDGTTKLLHLEQDPAWVNIEPSVPRWVAGDHFLWFSERDGWPRLELRGSDGALSRVLTPDGVTVRSVIAVDHSRPSPRVWVSYSPKDDPTTVHVGTVLTTGGELQPLTQRPGHHSAYVDEDTGRYVLASHLADGRALWAVFGPRGEALGDIASRAESPPWKPNVSWVRVGDSSEALHAAVVRPRAFDPAQRYPVLVNVYGGPLAQMVRRVGSSYLLNQWFADHGYIVVRIDGRGTPGRGRDWERAIAGNFIANPLDDQVRGLKALGERFPEMDLSRVGIYGWSFGGYFSAMAVMQRPDVYHAAIAGAPVCDWRDYDTHYTERYIGLPQSHKAAYDASNVLTYANALQRPLLIMHGTADDNVYFTHAVKMSDALFRAGIDHAFLPLSGFTHMVPDPNVTSRLYTRHLSFFERHVKRRAIPSP